MTQCKHRLINTRKFENDLTKLINHSKFQEQALNNNSTTPSKIWNLIQPPDVFPCSALDFYIIGLGFLKHQIYIWSLYVDLQLTKDLVWVHQKQDYLLLRESNTEMKKFEDRRPHHWAKKPKIGQIQEYLIAYVIVSY